MKPLSLSKILVVGLARNCAGSICEVTSALKRSFAAASDVKMLVIESDSSDCTVELLDGLQEKDPSFSYASLGCLSQCFPKRTERLAICRNKYLDIIRSSPEYSGLDYVVVADLDGMNLPLTSGAVESCWTSHEWDVCAANQAGPYYDIWALRHPIWCPSDALEQSRMLQRYGLSEYAATYACVTSKMVRIPVDHDWIEVESAFGGLALYKASSLMSGSYIGLNSLGDEMCEHVSLHRAIRSAGGRIFINPRLVNHGTSEHVTNASVGRLLVFWLRCQAKTMLRLIIRLCRIAHS